MFNIHTSMLAANEELEKLIAKNAELTEKNEKLGLMVVNRESLKHEVDYLKNKLVCTKQIELALIEHLVENKLKINCYKNSVNVVQTYHEKNTKSMKVGIGFDCKNVKERKDAFKKNKGPCANNGVPKILKNVDKSLQKGYFVV